MLPSGAAVLDVGCGHGRQAIGLLDYDIGSYTGLDVVPESIAFCRTAFAAIPCFRFEHLDVKNAVLSAAMAAMYNGFML